MITSLPDGLYVVDYRGIFAAFVVEDSRVTRCAPILKKRIKYWVTVAHRIA